LKEVLEDINLLLIIRLMSKSESTINEEFGAYLRTKRVRAGLSQSEVARELGYSSAQFISNFERGLCAPPLPALRKIVDCYKIPKKEVINLMLRQQKRYLENVLSDSRRLKRAS